MRFCLKLSFFNIGFPFFNVRILLLLWNSSTAFFKKQCYKIEFNNKDDYEKFKKIGFDIIRDQEKYNQVTISVEKTKINQLFKQLTMFDVKFINEIKYNLEKHFNSIIKTKKENKND